MPLCSPLTFCCRSAAAGYHVVDNAPRLRGLECTFTFPRQLTGSQLDGSSNTAFIGALYAAMHASTSISSRPSMMAMSLSRQPSLAALQSYRPPTRPCLCRR